MKIEHSTKIDWNISLIRDAIEDMRKARNRLRYGNAPRAAEYVARAMKSAEGALRHQIGRRERARAHLNEAHADDCRYTGAAPVVHDALDDKRRDDARSDDRE